MVDSIISYKSGKTPSLLAGYAFKNGGPLRFHTDPGDHWPSMYVMEGLGQSCNLLLVVYALEKHLVKAGYSVSSMDEVFRKLVDREPDEATGFLKDILHQRQVETYSSIGFMGAADMEITGHARQGQSILYEVQLNQVFGTLFHLAVKAYTDNRLIAHGTMVSASRKGL